MYCFIILSWYKCFFFGHNVQMVEVNISFSRGKEGNKGPCYSSCVFEGIINISNSSKLSHQRV
jgi:hypothetical protein